MTHLSASAVEIVAHLQATLRALDDLKSQPEREYVYSVLVSHVRSAAPMRLLGGVADVIEPVQRGRDVGVEMTAAQKEEVRVALGAVRP